MNIVRAAFLLSLVGTAAGEALAQGPMPERIVPTNFMSQRQSHLLD